MIGYAVNKVLVSQMKDADVSDKILHDFSGKVQQLNICMELLNGKNINKLIIDGNLFTLFKNSLNITINLCLYLSK